MIAAAQLRSGRSHGVVSQLPSQQLFLVVWVLLFATSAALTILCCRSMSSAGAMPMPGGWSMSMTWMRMPGQTWLGAAASFFGMWIVMMIAMMLPSLVPMLGHYRQAVSGTNDTPCGQKTRTA